MVEKYPKMILVIGGQNEITYKEIFTLMKFDKLWPSNT
ncbi:MAG: adenine-specific methyltransferase EcoRI family protein [Christensenellaceae bacterium]|nr:adenine-specific methyltransferase EcoRI family protein [Christensenellaceae bacterium]